MPPQRVRKRASGASATSSNAGLQSVTAGKRNSPMASLKKSPSSRRVHITYGQKQALIDNLQLEITERARKMRAQYALQAQGLRTRLEIRVHRIPAALRHTNIADLLKKYSEQMSVKSPSKGDKRAGKGYQETDIAASISVQKAGQARGQKRKSDEREGDKENTDSALAGPKKRSRIVNAQTAATNTAGTAGRHVPTSQILSPKSNNSRAVPQSPSPFKSAMSPTKLNPARPASPLKPSITAPTTTSLAKTSEKPSKAKTQGPRTASKQDKPSTKALKQTQTKRAAAAAPPRIVDQESEAPQPRTSNVSDAASSSAGTTIVRVTKKAPNPAAPASGIAKGKVAGVKAKFEGIAGNGKKVTTAKSASVTATAKSASVTATGGTVKGGRTLRKRA